MKEIGAIFVVSISEIRTVKLAAIKRRYRFPLYQYWHIILFFFFTNVGSLFTIIGIFSLFCQCWDI